MKLTTAGQILLPVALLFVLAASSPRPTEGREEPYWKQWVSLRDWRGGVPAPRGRGRRSHPQALMEQAALGVGDFALRLYRSLAYRKTNLLLPPLALYTALAATMTAARSRTLGELKTRLRAHGRSDTLPFAMHQLARALRPDRVSAVSMETATAVFRQDETCLKPPFLARMKRFYGAEVVSPGPREEGLNSWVEEHTQGMLTHAAKGLVDPRVALAFLTSLRMRAPWNSAFHLVRHHESSFFSDDRLQGTVQMLSTTGYFRQGRSEALGCRVLELPYKGHQVALYVFLPETPGGLRALDAAITHHSVEAAIESLTLNRESKILVALPKIKLRARMNLKKALKSMGMRKMFQQTQADLSAIDGTHDYYVTDVCTGSKVEDVDIGEVMAAARRPKDGVLNIDGRIITNSTVVEASSFDDILLVDEDKAYVVNRTQDAAASHDDASQGAKGKSQLNVSPLPDIPQKKKAHEVPQKEISNVHTPLNDVPIDAGVYDSYYPASQHFSGNVVRIPLITTDEEHGARKDGLDPASQTVHKVKVEIIPSKALAMGPVSVPTPALSAI